MTTIYTDASADANLNVCAWAYVIHTQAKKTLIQAGYYENCDITTGEIRAVVKALGRCKTFSGKIVIYCDQIQISELYANRKKSRWSKRFKRVPAWACLWSCIVNYQLRLSILYIRSADNPAHKYAKAELQRVRGLLREAEPFHDVQSIEDPE